MFGRIMKLIFTIIVFCIILSIIFYKANFFFKNEKKLEFSSISEVNDIKNPSTPTKSFCGNGIDDDIRKLEKLIEFIDDLKISDQIIYKIKKDVNFQLEFEKTLVFSKLGKEAYENMRKNEEKK